MVTCLPSDKNSEHTIESTEIEDLRDLQIELQTEAKVEKVVDASSSTPSSAYSASDCTSWLERHSRADWVSPDKEFCPFG